MKVGREESFCMMKETGVNASFSTIGRELERNKWSARLSRTLARMHVCKSMTAVCCLSSTFFGTLVFTRRCLSHLPSNAVRYSAIERDNQKLLSKMTSILMHSNPAFADHRPAGPRSLNIGARRAEMTRITADNHVSVSHSHCRARTIASPAPSRCVLQIQCNPYCPPPSPPHQPHSLPFYHATPSPCCSNSSTASFMRGLI